MQRRHLSAEIAAVAGPTPAGFQAGSDDRRPAEDGKFWTGGTVTAVDASAGAVTITRLGKGGAGATETVSVAAEAAVTVDRTRATLAGLPVGARALITGTIGPGRDATRTATRIDAATSWPLRLGGAVASVGAGTLTLIERDNTTMTVRVGPGVPVTLDGQLSSLAGLPVGVRIWVEGTATATSQTVARVEARTASAKPGPNGGPKRRAKKRRAAEKASSGK
jgi:hypothetical protein